MAAADGWPVLPRNLRTFVERWSLPAVAAFRRQDLLDTRHDLYVGEFGLGIIQHSASAWESDLLIVLGSRLGETSTGGYTLLDIPSNNAWSFHADPEELGRVYAVDLPIVATPSGNSPRPRPAWKPPTFLAGLEPEPAPGLPRLVDAPARPAAVDLGAIAAGLAQRLPPDTILTNGAGNYDLAGELPTAASAQSAPASRGDGLQGLPEPPSPPN